MYVCTHPYMQSCNSGMNTVGVTSHSLNVFSLPHKMELRRSTVIRTKNPWLLS